MIAGGVTASCMIWFAYRAVLNIDRAVVAFYPRIVFLELILEYDFYHDDLNRRRIDRFIGCEEMHSTTGPPRV